MSRSTHVPLERSETTVLRGVNAKAKGTEHRFPPLTPLAVMPLHESGHHGVEDVWACKVSLAEAPALVDVLTFDHRCPDCVARAEACIAAGHDPAQEWKATAPAQTVTLSWLVARARYWQARGGAA